MASVRPGLILAMALLLAGCSEPLEQADMPERTTSQPKEFQFDLNKVTLKQLLANREKMGKPSERILRNIVEFRRQFRYSRVADLLAVKGIGEKTYLKIRRFFFVKPPAGR
jgi:DNA uptake protein ComE-like DNA-binding protein